MRCVVANWLVCKNSFSPGKPIVGAVMLLLPCYVCVYTYIILVPCVGGFTATSTLCQRSKLVLWGWKLPVPQSVRQLARANRQWQKLPIPDKLNDRCNLTATNPATGFTDLWSAVLHLYKASRLSLFRETRPCCMPRGGIVTGELCDWIWENEPLVSKLRKRQWI